MDQETQRLQLKKLIIQGKEQGFLTYRDINDHLPEGVHDTDQIEAVINMINDMGIEVYDQAPTRTHCCSRPKPPPPRTRRRRSPKRLSRCWPRPSTTNLAHHRPGAHVHARDGYGGAAYARGRD